MAVSAATGCGSRSSVISLAAPGIFYGINTLPPLLWAPSGGYDAAPREGLITILASIGYVRFWPKADIPRCTAYVCFRGKADMTFCEHMSAFAVAFGGKADIAYCTAYVRL